MVKGKGFVVDKEERTARGIRKSPEQKEKVIDWTWPWEKQKQSSERKGT